MTTMDLLRRRAVIIASLNYVNSDDEAATLQAELANVNQQLEALRDNELASHHFPEKDTSYDLEEAKKLLGLD